MEKEKSNIQNLSVCYCLMKRESSNQTGTVRMSPMTEMLNHVQAFYENKGAAVYSQAFVYGNQNAFARAFEQYPFGFRAGLDENVEKYDLTEMLVLCCGLLEDYLPGSEENRGEEEIKDVYRLVIISDYPLNTDSEAIEQLVNHIKALKRRCDFKIVYVVVFKSDGSTIDFLQPSDDFTERERSSVHEGADVDGLVHILLSESHIFRIDGATGLVRRSQRVKAGALVSHDPVGPDELVDAPAAFRAFRRNGVGGCVRGVPRIFFFPGGSTAPQFVAVEPGGPERVHGQGIVFP